MNTPLLPPRAAAQPASLMCRLVRLACALEGKGNFRHVASCPSCQRHFQQEAALNTALRSEARAQVSRTPMADGFERRLLHAVRNAQVESAAQRTSLGWAWGWGGRAGWATGGLAAAVALVVLAFFFRADPDLGRRENLAGGSVATDAAVMVDVVETISHQLVDSVIPSAGQMVASNPLQQEIGSVYADMRSALDFLALNFLPVAAVRGEAQPSRRI